MSRIISVCSLHTTTGCNHILVASTKIRDIAFVGLLAAHQCQNVSPVGRATPFSGRNTRMWSRTIKLGLVCADAFTSATGRTCYGPPSNGNTTHAPWIDATISTRACSAHDRHWAREWHIRCELSRCVRTSIWPTPSPPRPHDHIHRPSRLIGFPRRPEVLHALL